MKPFTVIAIDESPITGITTLKAEWTNTNGEEKKIDLTFGSLEFANYRVRLNKKQWILAHLEKWVLHKKLIIENGKNSKNLIKIQSLFKATESIKLLQGKELHTICSQIIKGLPIYQSLLPSMNNTSYKSSVENLQVIIDFANQNQAQ
jgi:hypothetical protein